MLLSTEVRRAEFVLLALQFITAVVGIWLLGRTSPALERILAENVDSLETVQNMQRGLHEESRDPGSGVARFESAFERAVQNITEPEEEAVLGEIRAEADVAFANGDGVATEALSASLAELAEINRNSMDRAYVDAKSVATAGAWSLVGLALTTVVVSFVFIRRTNDRIVAPVHHLHEVATSYERGETLRRCEKFGMPDELRFVAETMNRLFDVEVRRKKGEHRRARRDDGHKLEPEALGALVASIPGALVLLGEDGAPLACTDEATPRLRELVSAAVRLGAKSRANEEASPTSGGKKSGRNKRRPSGAEPERAEPSGETERPKADMSVPDEAIELRELSGGLYLIMEKGS